MVGMMISVLLTVLPTMCFRIACYVLTSLGLYTMAKSRGITKSWLAWIPVVNLWLIGSLSDQYRYVVRRQIRNKRMILLVLRIAALILASIVSGLAGGVIRVLSMGFMNHISVPMLNEMLTRQGLVLLFWVLPLMIVGTIEKILEYMAFFDIYESCDPENSVVYLVFSIFFGVTKPFFLFFNRNREKGMPPRLAEQEFPHESEWEA